MEMKDRKRAAGLKRLDITLAPDTEFEEIVRYLEGVLTIPELPGVRGCQPCLSGLDRLVLDSVLFEQIG